MTADLKAKLRLVREAAETAAQPYLNDAALVVAVVGVIGEARDVPHQPSEDSKLPVEALGAVNAFLETGTLDGVVQPERYWVLIAEALAAVAISGAPTAARVAASRERLGESPAWVHDVWMDACRRRLGELAATELEAWLDELGRMPDIQREDKPRPRAVVVLRTSPSWAVSDSLQLWTEDPVAFDAIGSWPPLNLLYHYNLARWLQAIDRWSDPRLVQGALFAAGARETDDEFIGLIRDARPCFLDDGTPTDACAAVVLCESAVQHAQRELNSKTENGKARTLEYFQKVVQTILRRPDGKTLALALASKTADEAFLTDNSNRVPSPVPALAWEAIAPALIGGAFSVAYQRKAQEQRRKRAPEESGAVRRALPALLVALRTLGDRRGDDVEALVGWLADAMSSPVDWADRGIVNYLLTIIVDILALAPEPTARARKMFASKERDRRRSESSRRYVVHHGELPSLLLLVALATLVLRGRNAQSADDLAFVRDRALRLALTHAAPTEPVVRAREVAALAVAVGVEIFGAADSRTEELARPIDNEREVLGHLLHRLRQVGKVDDVDALVRTLRRNPGDLITVAEEWAAATAIPFDGDIAKATRNALRPSDTTDLKLQQEVLE